MGMRLLLPVLLLAIPAASHGADVYLKQDTLPATMIATRARYQATLDSAPVKATPWFATASLKAKGFNDPLFPEQGVDLAAKDDKGQPVWQQHPEWVDGSVHGLSAADSSSTYLFRTLTVKAASTITAGFGSDDGIEVWLNHKKIHSNNAGRGVSPDQDKVALDLAAGENLLLVKIYNGGGGSGFYFNPGISPSVDVWPQLKKDFPLEAGWLHRDTGGKLEAWFASRDSVAGEKELISHPLGALGQQGVLHQEQAKLEQDKVPANDPRWLNLYLRACQVREAKANLGRIDTAALGRAIEDLSTAYPAKYARGPEFRQRLEVCNKKIEDLRLALDRGEQPDMKSLNEVVALQREALLANPLMDFDRLLLVKRNQLGLPQNWQGNTSIGKHGYDSQIAVLSPVRPGGKLTTLFKPQDSAFVGDVDLEFGGERMLT